jgi:hypothetical protein
MTTLRCEPLTIPGAPLGEENPLPFFRDPQISLDFTAHASLPPEKRAYLGWETAFRVLPYRMQDQYTRQRRPLSFRSVVLENEFLTATFLPELGGRLISLIYKPQIRELLHRNPVFQPANLAIRNAWFSGGIEWNIGQFGHTFFTCAPVFAAAIQGAQDEPGLRLYEYERCKGLFWHIDFYLPPGCPFLIAYTRVVNPNDDPGAMYWWTNVAVNERPGVRVLSPARQAIYLHFDQDGHSFGLTDLPGLPSLGGADGTYSIHSTFANEFFFQCEGDQPWEAALDETGSGFIETSTARLRYRKLFCWGTHPGGRHWQEFLAQPGEAYLEIQAGLAPSQVHGLPMPARSAWDWTQAFGYVEADPAKVHGDDWDAAIQTVDAALQARLPLEELTRLEGDCRQRADTPSRVILHPASGWGALETLRRARTPGVESTPTGLVFPESSLGPEQSKWLALLESGAFPDQPPSDPPGEWMVQPEWETLLEKSPQNWVALLHLGVMRLERGDQAGAEAAWQESIRLTPSAWAYRNLAILALRRKQNDLAHACYEQAWALAEAAGNPPPALAIEFLEKLVETEQWQRGMDTYNALPPVVQSAERVQILRGQFALALGDLDAVEEVLAREVAVVREGETVLSDLWFGLHARRHGLTRPEAEQRFPPPAPIDFRSFS